MEGMLRELEQRIESNGPTGADLRELWKLINQAKLKERIDEDTVARIVRLRDRFFDELYPPIMSLRQGLAVTAIMILTGVIVTWYSLKLLEQFDFFMFLIGAILLIVGTHPWGHWIAGICVGVGYEYFYLNGPARFEPCLKIEYNNYLKADFDSRMVVHASGALATILTSLTLMLVALAKESLWIRGVGAALFVVVLTTEVISWTGTAQGDLKRARREAKLKKLRLKLLKEIKSSSDGDKEDTEF